MLEFVIERIRFFGKVDAAVVAIAYGPTGDSFNVTFDPPSIQDAQAWYPIEGRLHPACAGSLHWPLGSVQPDIHSRAQRPRQLHVIVFHVDDADIVAQARREFENPPDQCFAVVILRMRLATVNHLERTHPLSDAFEPLEVFE